MEIISLTSKNFQESVQIAAGIIKKGGVIVAPTDTVYGLLADATNEKAVGRLYKIKRRDSSRYLPIFVKNMAMAKKIAKIPTKIESILEEKWPGKFTAVLPKKNAKIFGVDKTTIALRIPHYAFINSLLETLNLPLTGTSANISGQHSSTRIDDVLRQFALIAPKPDLVANAGDLRHSKSSTIIDLSGNQPKTIRQ